MGFMEEDKTPTQSGHLQTPRTVKSKMETPMNQRGFEDIRVRLEQHQASVATRRAKLAKHVHHREEPLPQDFAEQAVETENSETMFALEEELSQQAKALDRALQRLDAGTYDVCEDCGSQIAPARLNALPTTAVCFKCANAS